jgi:hypothetical protein
MQGQATVDTAAFMVQWKEWISFLQLNHVWEHQVVGSAFMLVWFTLNKREELGNVGSYFTDWCALFFIMDRSVRALTVTQSLLPRCYRDLHAYIFGIEGNCTLQTCSTNYLAYIHESMQCTRLTITGAARVPADQVTFYIQGDSHQATSNSKEVSNIASTTNAVRSS